jgi:hypothetical protein
LKGWYFVTCIQWTEERCCEKHCSVNEVELRTYEKKTTPTKLVNIKKLIRISTLTCREEFEHMLDNWFVHCYGDIWYLNRGKHTQPPFVASKINTTINEILRVGGIQLCCTIPVLGQLFMIMNSIIVFIQSQINTSCEQYFPWGHFIRVFVHLS